MQVGTFTEAKHIAKKLSQEGGQYACVYISNFNFYVETQVPEVFRKGEELLIEYKNGCIVDYEKS